MKHIKRTLPCTLAFLLAVCLGACQARPEAAPSSLAAGAEETSSPLSVEPVSPAEESSRDEMFQKAADKPYGNVQVPVRKILSEKGVNQVLDTPYILSDPGTQGFDCKQVEPGQVLYMAEYILGGEPTPNELIDEPRPSEDRTFCYKDSIYLYGMRYTDFADQVLTPVSKGKKFTIDEILAKCKKMIWLLEYDNKREQMGRVFLFGNEMGLPTRYDRVKTSQSAEFFRGRNGIYCEEGGGGMRAYDVFFKEAYIREIEAYIKDEIQQVYMLCLATDPAFPYQEREALIKGKKGEYVITLFPSVWGVANGPYGTDGRAFNVLFHTFLGTIDQYPPSSYTSPTAQPWYTLNGYLKAAYDYYKGWPIEGTEDENGENGRILQ